MGSKKTNTTSYVSKFRNGKMVRQVSEKTSGTVWNFVYDLSMTRIPRFTHVYFQIFEDLVHDKTNI